MDIKILTEFKQLSEIERTALGILTNDNYTSVENLAKSAKMNLDSARRACEWLSVKELAEKKEEEKEEMVLTTAGLTALSKGLPEKIFIEALKMRGGKIGLLEIKNECGLSEAEFNAALGTAKKNAWISISKEGNAVTLELTGLEKDVLEGAYSLELLLKSIKETSQSKNSSPEMQELVKRGLVEKQLATTSEFKLTPLGLEVKNFLPSLSGKRAFDIKGTAPKILMGRRHPYMRFLNDVRRRLVEMGFTQMDTRMVTQEFYNFDVLFQPQNHPARTWTDTYQLKNPAKGTLPGKKIVDAVAMAHENGGKTGSTGWGYKWNPKIAMRLMPAAHGTAHSARTLVNGINVPGKYFAIARCYRPDIMDASHLIEFNQIEGFIVGENLNFRNLLGMLKEFATEIAGAKEVRFYPDYYPFTEPSVQLSAKHPDLGWIEFAGAGIFRPEMTQTLGIKEPVIAWGIGADRLAMCALASKDIRDLFSDNLNWLRKAKINY